VKYIAVGRSSTKNVYMYTSIYVRARCTIYVQCSASFASSRVFGIDRDLSGHVYIRTCTIYTFIYTHAVVIDSNYLSRSTYVRSRIYGCTSWSWTTRASDDVVRTCAPPETTDDRLHVVFFFILFCSFGHAWMPNIAGTTAMFFF
jgi:hypothetical protein